MAKCQVSNCEDTAEYRNEHTGLKYCLPHAKKLNFTIKQEGKVVSRLVKIE